MKWFYSEAHAFRQILASLSVTNLKRRLPVDGELWTAHTQSVRQRYYQLCLSASWKQCHWQGSDSRFTTEESFDAFEGCPRACVYGVSVCVCVTPTRAQLIQPSVLF